MVRKNITKKGKDMTPEEFKTIRLGASYTQKKLGERLDLAPLQIKRYEAGKAEIPRPVADVMRYLIGSQGVM